MLKEIFENIYYYLDEELEKRAMELLDIEDLSNLSINHVDYLYVIKENGNPTLSEIAEELNFSKPSVTIMINKLIQLGLVKKAQSEDDKRVFYIELTDLGREIVDIQLNIYREFANRLENVLEGNEIERLASLL